VAAAECHRSRHRLIFDCSQVPVLFHAAAVVAKLTGTLLATGNIRTFLIRYDAFRMLIAKRNWTSCVILHDLLPVFAPGHASEVSGSTFSGTGPSGFPEHRDEYTHHILDSRSRACLQNTQSYPPAARATNIVWPKPRPTANIPSFPRKTALFTESPFLS